MQKRTKLIMYGAAGVVIMLVIVGGGYLLLRPTGSPEQTARQFLTAWQHGDHAAMRRLVTKPPADFGQRYERLRTNLGVTKITPRLGKVSTADDTTRAAFTVTLQLNAVGAWSYDNALNLTESDGDWKVDWSPAAIHPKLRADQRLKLATRWPERGHILAADHSRMDTPNASGSVQQLTGVVSEATAKDIKRLGAPYHKGDLVGQSGIQQQFETRLAGTPSTIIGVVDGNGKTVARVGRIAGHKGRDVATSLDPKVQQAAAQAISKQHKPTALVAIRPSTGEVLAVANKPGGFNRALVGRYAPGSTFKVVTAVALSKAGVTPRSTVQCPETVDIGGMTVHNAEDEQFGAISFKKAFAKSCNTAFAGTAKDKLSPAELTTTAELFGFNTPMHIGVPTLSGKFPKPADSAELAVASFGQGKVTANPLQMASVSAGVADGTWRPPRLVTHPKVKQEAQAHKLPGSAAKETRMMMRSVVTSGTAASVGLPSGTAGKTGTAEFGSGPEPPTHAWFTAYRHDVAMAVVVEDGGVGAQVAGPVSAKFLNGL